MSEFIRDLRLALRSLLRAPLLLGAAVLTLAISIGLNTAVFSVVDAVVMRPLPVHDPASLVALCEVDAGNVSDWCGASVPNVMDVAARSHTLSVVGAARGWPFVMRTTEGAEGVRGGLASAEAFEALGVRPFLGRLIRPDDAGKSWRRVVVLSYETWRARFGAQRDVIGRAITLDDEPHEIIGVLPPNARFPRLERIDFWRPLHFDPRDEEERGWRGFQIFARLKPGISIDAAQRDVASIASDIQHTHLPDKRGWSIGVTSWQTIITGSVRTSMYLLLGAVAFLLLIGCANVANLLLSRSTSRQRELAVRAALGASSARLARVVLAESVVIAALGTALGVIVAWWSVRLVVLLAPSGIPHIDTVMVDPRALAFAILLSLVASVIVGIVPAFRAARLDLRSTIGDGGRTGVGRDTRRIGAALIVGEITLAVMLVTGAGLLGRTFAVLSSWKPGFEQEHLLTSWLLASPGRFQTKRDLWTYFERGADEVRTIPGVAAVGTASAGPLFGGDGDQEFTLDGQPAPQGTRQAVSWFDISPGYFRAIGLPIVDGRDIAPNDDDAAPNVAIVNESFVRRYFQGRPPLGRSVHMVEHKMDFTIVGVVRDVPALKPGDPIPAEIYWPNRQVPRPATYIVVRTSGDPATVASAMRARLRAFDPTLQVTQVRSMHDWLSQELVRPRFGAVMFSAFGVVALILAAIGTYGLLAYAVAQETRQLGVRLALGATPHVVMREVLGRGMRLAGIAVVLGLAGSVALSRVLQGLLAGVSAVDPISLGGSMATLLAVAALACWIPARRAARVDPVEALRA